MDLEATIGLLGCKLWSATLVGNAAPSIVQLRERMRPPRAGDLVVELSTHGKVVGHLERTAWEPVASWDDDEEPAPRELVWYILRLSSGKAERWTNCDFVAVPEPTDAPPGSLDEWGFSRTLGPK